MSPVCIFGMHLLGPARWQRSTYRCVCVCVRALDSRLGEWQWASGHLLSVFLVYQYTLCVAPARQRLVHPHRFPKRAGTFSQWGIPHSEVSETAEKFPGPLPLRRGSEQARIGNKLQITTGHTHKQTSRRRTGTHTPHNLPYTGTPQLSHSTVKILCSRMKKDQWLQYEFPVGMRLKY